MPQARCCQGMLEARLCITRFGHFSIGLVRVKERALKLRIWFRELLNGLGGLSGLRRGTSGTTLATRHVYCR